MAALLRSSLLRFGVIGALAFAVDAGILTVLNLMAGWPPVSARLISFPVALTVSWYLNRTWSFSEGRSRAAMKQYGTYAVIQAIGALLNLAIFTGLVEFHPLLAAWPIVPLGIAAIFAMVFNYYAARRFAFGGASVSRD